MTDPPGSFARPGAPAVEAAAALLRRAVVEGGSAFTPGVAVWTLEHAHELRTSFNGRRDVPGASFDDKLRRQLADVSPGGVQLFAELFYLDLLPLSDYREATKRALITGVLDLAGHSFALPEPIDTALGVGVLNGGVAFKSRRYQQLCYLIEWAVGLLGELPDQRSQLLGDPLAFRAAADRWTTTNSPSQRATLLYLMFPEFYLPIAKTDHKAAIRAAFADHLDRPTGDVDQDLHEIYAQLCRDAGEAHVDLYQAPYREQWDSSARPSWAMFIRWAARIAEAFDLDTREREYKLRTARRLDEARTTLLAGDPGWPAAVRAGLDHGNLLDRFLTPRLFDAITADPARAAAVLTRFWTAEADPSLLTALHDDLQSLLTVTRGNATAIGAVLLMARDATQYPPYRPTPVDRARVLTGSATAGAEPSGRYEDLLAICDELLERAPDAGIELRDRLDAQGLMFAVVKYDPPADWSEQDRSAFLRWRGVGADETAPGRHAWLVRHSDDSSVSVAAGPVRRLLPGAEPDEIRSAVAADLGHLSYAARSDRAGDLDAVLNRVAIDDIVLTAADEQVRIGRVTGEPEHGDGRISRTVDWQQFVPVGSLPADMTAKFQVQRDIVDFTGHLDPLEAALTGDALPVSSPAALLPDATAELANRLHVGQGWLQECVELLRDRPQLVFYGPPGTGKTYIAQELGRHLAGERVRLVQFHPAYSYEDFFEGFRPTASGGFALTAGPMRRIVDAATQDPSHLHVLIIDELNRGNLAKVFGELYFLLEYRDRSVELLYGSGDFSLPGNVVVIGTMNTADRSIALVDAAMRRRFAFVALHPSEPPTAGVLRAWLSATGRPSRAADLLDELNSRIEDPEFRIGPSYLMRPDVHATGGFARAWRTAILPLLEEHHYGELDRAGVQGRYGYEAVAAAVDRRPDRRAGDDPPPAAD